jgi:hypothetical protein
VIIIRPRRLVLIEASAGCDTGCVQALLLCPVEPSYGLLCLLDALSSCST